MTKFLAGPHDFDWSGPGDDGSIAGINFDSLDLKQSITGFITLVDAVLALPANQFVTAGRNGTTDAGSNLFWLYSPELGLAVEATPGYLTTQTGNGGFDLRVDPSGSWSLSFDGSNQVIGHDSDSKNPVRTPKPAHGLPVVTIPGTGASAFDASALPPTLVNGGLGWDTVQGGVGDYILGGSGTAGGGLAGKGNCAVYTSSPGSILVDAENGYGYGGNAEGNEYANVNQIRGSMYSNVLIGNTDGTDLKSGGNNSLLISTGGNGFELRPDGFGNVLVSTVGADRAVFDPAHGWQLGDDNIMLGFNAAHGDSLDLTALTGGKPIAVVGGPSVVSNFHSLSAAGYSAATGTGDINDYVKIVDAADGSHVLFSATGQVGSSGTELLDLKFAHGLSVTSLYANHQILV